MYHHHLFCVLSQHFYSIVLGLEVLGNPAGFIHLRYEIDMFTTIIKLVPSRELFWGLESFLKASHWEADSLLEELLVCLSHCNVVHVFALNTHVLYLRT